MNKPDTNIFFLPTAYLHRVRLASHLGRILSWWFLLVVPTLGYYLLAQPCPTPEVIGSYLLLLAAVVPYYELGYMFNDTFTTRREIEPTLRLTEAQSAYFYRHAGLIVGVRMVWVLGLLCLFGYLNAWSCHALITIVATLLLLPVFAIYNRIRGLAAVCFYPVLICWRYLVFLLPAIGQDNFGLCAVLTVLSYPLLISLERYSMPRHRYGLMAKLLPSESSKQPFRAAYYGILLIALLPLWWHRPMLSLPIVLLALYRLIRYVLTTPKGLTETQTKTQTKTMKRTTLLFLLCLTQALCTTLGAETMPRVLLTYDSLSNTRFTLGTFTLVQDSDTLALPIEVRHRGASSLQYDKPSYAVKLYDTLGIKLDTALLGMRSDNYWVLDAMAVDKARMRNRVSMDLWLEFSRKPWYQALEPNMLNGYRGKMVEVYVNDSAQGIYCLMERVDRKQLKLKKYSEKKGVQGLMYKSVANNRSVIYYLWNQPDTTLGIWDGWEQKYPDPEDGEPITWSRFYHHIYALTRTTNYAIYPDTAQTYLDMPVYIDYILFCQLLSARDNVSKNINVSFYDATTLRALYTPWDLDHSWGRQYNSTEELPTALVAFSNNYLYKRMTTYYHIQDTLEARYAELRKHYFTIEHIDSLFASYFDLYAATGMDTLEQRLWSGHNDIEFDIAAEQSYIHNWVVERLAHLDNLYHYTPTGAVTQTQTPTRTKMLHNGHIIILRDDECYDMLGRKLEDDPEYIDSH